MASIHSDRTIALPPERFYWGRIETAHLGARPKRESLLYLFEAQLPVPLETVHVVFVRSQPHVWIACAMERAALDAIVSDAPEALHPEALPDFLGVELAADRFEMLHGEYLPRSLRRWRRLQHAVAALTVAAVLGIVSAASLARAADLEQDARAARVGEADLYQRQLGYVLSPERLPGPLQAAAELRSLTKTRTAGSGASDADLARALELLLARIPSDLRFEAESLHVTRESLHFRASMASAADAQRFAVATREIEGYRAEIPEVRTVGSICSAAFRWTRVEVPR